MVATGNCTRCGKLYVGGIRDTNRRYCSVECRESFWNEKRRKGLTTGEIKGRYATPVATVQMTPEQIAYLAGFMDGEGHIGIARWVQPRNVSGVRYRAAMEVSNTNLAALERMKEWLGGNGWISSAERPKNTNGRPLYRIRFSRRQIAYILPMLLPHLIIKAAAADVVLRFIGLVEGSPPQTAVLAEQFDALWQEARALNKRGRY